MIYNIHPDEWTEEAARVEADRLEARKAELLAEIANLDEKIRKEKESQK